MLNWKQILLLGFLGIMVSAGIAYFQDSPGYMDADYYFAGGLQLASGEGFTAPYLWNYLDNPDSLPHPSHSYWMPLASILAAIGMGLTGQKTWLMGRLGFLIIATIIPIITYTLAYSFSKQRDIALISGLLAIFSGFYAAFIPVTDTFGIYMVLGGIYFLVAHRYRIWNNFSLGVIAGLMHLARNDGIIWLLISFLIIIFKPVNKTSNPKLKMKLLMGFLCLVGYLSIMGAWLFRNEIVFGSLLAPGGEKMFWLTNYDQIFSYPPGSITFVSWLQKGLLYALKVRLWALNINLQNTLASQASIFLLPLIIIGIWKLRKDRRVIIAVITWFFYLVLMSFVFPFAGARGGFFHSGAAFQPMWWAIAPIGLVAIIDWVGMKRAWRIEEALRVFLWVTIVLSILITGYIVNGKLFNPIDGSNIWSKQFNLYSKVDTMIDINSQLNPIVIVANPPGFYLATGKSAIAIPDGDQQTTLLVAQIFDAKYLILEDGGYPIGLKNLYLYPENYPKFYYIGELEGARVFKIKP